ncbi:MAG: hypothetical protein GX552_17315 [Chloroflexi bacterium]|jgi:heme-degrading monooxygenase HmoA|nr:hypothetical protein [Chloroflexota bacterium]
MITLIIRWNIHPDKIQAYTAWAQSAVPRLLAAPGLSELRAYRPLIGDSQVVTVYEFASLEDWITWNTSADVRETTEARRAFTLNERSELWGASPTWPEPLRAEGETPST